MLGETAHLVHFRPKWVQFLDADVQCAATNTWVSPYDIWRSDGGFTVNGPTAGVTRSRQQN